MNRHGMTLIEVLVVGCLITILATVAMPNFVEAQLRSKVSRVHADLKSLSVAMEAYRTDYNSYPVCLAGHLNSQPFPVALEPALPLHAVTTPLAYLTGLPPEIFPDRYFRGRFPVRQYHYQYFSPWWTKKVVSLNSVLLKNISPAAQWAVTSMGPDCFISHGECRIFGLNLMHRVNVGRQLNMRAGIEPTLYDPTNGSVSAGDIVRIGP